MRSVCAAGSEAQMARWALATGLLYAALAVAASAGEDAEAGAEEVVLPEWTEDTDYYEVLGVERDAGDRDIKRAYRKRALLYHPDKHPPALKAGVERLFVIVATAYDVLSDPERRSNYDKFGHAGEGEEGPGYSSFEDAFQAHGYGDVEDTAFNWVMLVLIGALSVLPAVLAVRARGKPRSRRDALMEARERSAAATRAADPQEDAAEAERRRRERERRAERRQRRKAADGPRVERDGAVAAAVRAGQEEEARAREAEREADLRRRQAGQRLVDAPSAADAPWTEGELSALAKGVAKFPGGTRDRWGHIARHVASVGMPHARTPDECAKQARTSAPAIRKIQREARGVGQDAGARLAEQEAAVRQEGEREGGSGGGGDGDKDKDRAWTVAEQKALEEALKACPPSMPTKERWRGIASRVPGRTAKECVARFKEVRAQVAAKAAMAKA